MGVKELESIGAGERLTTPLLQHPGTPPFNRLWAAARRAQP